MRTRSEPPSPACALPLRFVLGIAAAAAAAAATATDGSYDAAFASQGRRLVAVTAGNDDAAQRMRLLPDGRVLLVGQCAASGTPDLTLCATRLRADGSGYDPSFGPGGVGYVNLAATAGFPLNTYFTDMDLLPDGRIALLGWHNGVDASDLIAVLKADGSGLDTGVLFGRGWAYLGLGANGLGSAAAIRAQPDGKLLVAGSAVGVNGNTDMAVERIEADFQGLDATFGNRTIAFDLGGPGGDNTDAVRAIALRDDGRIVLAGAALVTAETAAVALAQLLPEGAPDPVFGADHDGRVVPLSGAGYASNVLLDHEGRVVYATTYGYVGRVQQGGSPDPGFNLGFGGGAVWIGYWQSIEALALQDDGKLLLAGNRERGGSGAPYWWAVTRLRRDGSLDAGYLGAGQEYGTFTDGSFGCCGYSDRAMAIAVAGDGIVLAGSGKASASGPTRFGVARLLLDDIFRDGFD